MTNFVLNTLENHQMIAHSFNTAFAEDLGQIDHIRIIV